MPGMAIRNWFAKWLAEKEIEDSGADAGSEAGGAFLAEVIWVYFTEYLDFSSNPISKKTNYFVNQPIPVLRPIH